MIFVLNCVLCLNSNVSIFPFFHVLQNNKLFIYILYLSCFLINISVFKEAVHYH
jgi:hypothetical protein